MSELSMQWDQMNGLRLLSGQYNRRAKGKEAFKDDIELLRSLPLFKGLDDHALRILSTESWHRTFEAGETLFYQGDLGTTCHLILEGRVRIFVIGEDGRELAIGIFSPGEIIGEMALFEGLPRSASVEALSHTHTLELDQSAVTRCLRRSPTLALRLLRALSARLRSTNEDAEWMMSLSVAERLMRRLRQLAQCSGRRVADGVKIMPPMTQQELATLVWTSRESVNRALSRLREEGKLRLDDGWIIVLDTPANI